MSTTTELRTPDDAVDALEGYADLLGTPGAIPFPVWALWTLRRGISARSPLTPEVVREIILDTTHDAGGPNIWSDSDWAELTRRLSALQPAPRLESVWFTVEDVAKAHGATLADGDWKPVADQLNASLAVKRVLQALGRNTK